LRNRVLLVRRALGLRQVDLAERAGVTRYTIGRIERDDGYGPSMLLAVAICIALGRRLSSLWWIEPDPEMDPGTPDAQAETQAAG
jgi:DNA-binding XRE family transcriptional regulator